MNSVSQLKHVHRDVAKHHRGVSVGFIKRIGTNSECNFNEVPLTVSRLAKCFRANAGKMELEMDLSNVIK